MATVTKLRDFATLRDKHPTDELAAKHWLEDRLDKAKNSGVFAEVITLTSPLANEFLKHNAENRPIRQAKLKQYVSDIENGRWELNGEGLIFSDQGAMNDGQHRCLAVVQTGSSIQTVITFGVTRESRRTVDNGAARSPGDHLAVEGITYSVDVAAIARFILAYERGNHKKLAETNRISPTEVVERALMDEAVHEAAVFSRGGYGKHKSVAPPSVLGFCYYQFKKKDPEQAKTFMRQVITGAQLAPDSPAYMVRERLIGLDRPVREHRIEFIFKAWNAYREKREVSRFVTTNELPEIV